MAKSRALLIPGFRLYCLLQMISITCTGMQCVVLPVFVYEQNNSGLALATLWATTALPLALLANGGAAADRYNRWSILLAAQLAALVQALALGAIATTHSPGAFSSWMFALVLVLNFSASMITVFEGPAREALKSGLVPRGDRKLVEELLQYYGALASLGWRIGLGIGGVLVVSLKNAAAVCFLLNAASYILGIAALLLIRPRLFPREEPQRTNYGTAAHPLSPRAWLRTMKEGWNFICSERQVWLLFAQMIAVVVFFKRYEPFLPAFAKDDLGDVASTGWLRIAMTIGAYCGFLWVRRVSGESGASWSYRAMILLSLALLALFALAKEPMAASFAFAIAAAAMLVQESYCVARIQSKAESGIQGRISAFRGTVTWGLESIIALPLGWTVGLYGIRPVLLILAALGTFFAIPLALLARRQAQTEAMPSAEVDTGNEVAVRS